MFMRIPRSKGAGSGKIPTTLGAAIVTVGLMLVGSSPADALTLRTHVMTPAANGYLRCVVTATGKRPIKIVCRITTDRRDDVTEFGTSFRTTTEDGFYAEESVGSFDRRGRRCQVVVHGARYKQIHATLTSFDADGRVIETIQAR